MRVQKNTNPLRRTPGANASNRKSQNKGKFFFISYLLIPSVLNELTAIHDDH